MWRTFVDIRGPRFLLHLFLLAGVLRFASSAACAADRPNLVLVGLGALRADVAERQDVAPTLQLLSRQGVQFVTAYSNLPWPRGAAATLLASGNSQRHGVRGPLDALAPGVVLLSELARQQGYDTVAVVSHFDLDPVFGFGQGFQFFDVRLNLPIIGNHSSPLPVASLFFGDFGRDRSLRAAKLQSNARRADDWTTEAALGALSKYRGRQLFLWISYFGASQTWGDEALRFRRRENYEAQVHSLDDQLERLVRGIDALKKGQDTLLVLYGESGFSFLEHGDYGVGSSLYETSVRVPLVFVWLGKLPTGHQVEAPVSLLDVAPTLADLLGWPAQKAWSGQSLRPWLTGESETPESPPVFLETFLPATVAGSRALPDEQGQVRRIGVAWQALRMGRYKLIRRRAHRLIDVPRPDPLPPAASSMLNSIELYDLANDPTEQRNMASSAPQVLEELARELEWWNSPDGNRADR